MTRREWLGATAAALTIAACRRPPYDPAQFAVPAVSAVSVMAAADYAVDFAEVIGRGLRELAVDVRGRRVFLKPNMVEYERDSAINTHAMVVVGAAIAFRSAGAASVVVGEGPGHRRDMEYLVTQTGLFEHLREERIAFVDLNHDDVADVPLGSRYTGMSTITLPVSLLQADFVVSMPKMKTHHWAALTAGMKNFFGAVPGAVYGWPKNLLHFKGIGNSILDLNATIRPQFAIVDAVTAMEGDGPIMGQARHMGCLVMGRDVVAVDATCARLMGLDPLRVDYLSAAAAYLGNVDVGRIEHRGEALRHLAQRFEVIEAFAGHRLSHGAAIER